MNIKKGENNILDEVIVWFIGMYILIFNYICKRKNKDIVLFIGLYWRIFVYIGILFYFYKYF